MSTRRAWTWNALLVAVEATLVAWAHVLGVAWSILAAGLAGLLLLGAAVVVYVVRVHVPRALGRYERPLAAALTAHAAATNRRSEPVTPAGPTGPTDPLDPRRVVTQEAA